METQTAVGDQETISSLLERQEIRDELVRKVRKLVRTDEEAEDVVHEVICSALQRDPGEIKNPKAFLNNGCWREAKGIYRERVRFVELDENVADEEDKRPDRVFERLESEGLVRELCASLRDPRQKQAFALRILEGWSYKEIAGYLGVPKETVGTWIFRAKRELQKSDALRANFRAKLKRGGRR